MNTRQWLAQLEFLLTAATHADAPSAHVFGRVVATAGGAERVVRGEVVLPCAVLNALSAARDSQHPGLRDQRIGVALAVHNTGDALGRSALMGSHQQVGTSKGLGVLELEDALANVLDVLNRTTAGGILLASSSEAEAVKSEEFGDVVIRAHELVARVTSAAEYPPANEVEPGVAKPITSALPGGHVVNLSWTVPPIRFDFHPAATYRKPFDTVKGGLVLRRAAGAVAPANPAAGSGVAITGSAFGSAAADNPGAGQFTYALFAQYQPIPGKTVTTAAATVTVNA